ncbi:MAG: Ig-like domain-containing protein [Heliobacteriaceae bacterium]|nr:Ig-like domain-containing protein [Heliobacteriaceae bacterium]
MLKGRQSLVMLLMILVLLLTVAGGLPAWAVDPPQPLDLAITATSLVPGEEARYTLKFSTDQQLDLAAGSRVEVLFPKQVTLTKDDITAEDPGCTLSKIQYASANAKGGYAVLNGTVDTVTTDKGQQFSFVVTSTGDCLVASNTDIYLIIPGVVNKPATAERNNNITLTVTTADGAGHTAVFNAALGDPPPAAPAGLTLTATGASAVTAVWQPVEGATRYQLLYAADPEGYFIQADDFDFKRDPNPGETGDLTDTKAEFSGGNSGLEAGRTYYFKVRAGNDFGYGPVSAAVPVETLALKPLTRNPAEDQTEVAVDLPVTVNFNQAVAIKDKDYICLYEKATGTPVPVAVSAQGATVTLAPGTGLTPETEYQVVFYYQALTAADNLKVWNEPFHWSFRTALFAAKTGVAVDKVWAIRFNQQMNKDTLNGQTILVLKDNVPVAVTVMPGEDGTSAVVNPPAGGYQLGGTYQLKVTQDVQSRTGSTLKSPVTMAFTIATAGKGGF